MKKRRVFDIDFDVETSDPKIETEDKSSGRRGPMATAIAESGDALAERQAKEALIRDENDRLAHEYVALKKEGRISTLVPILSIEVAHLTRDRLATRDVEIDELKDSIRVIGLSNPIQVQELEGGTYALVQGYRRLTAFRELFTETKDPQWEVIPAAVLHKGTGLEGLYQRMVDENLIRKGIGFGEMAALALAYADDPETSADTVGVAVDQLFVSAGRQKRAYIKSFARLLGLLDGALTQLDVVPRALGLDVLKRLEAEPSRTQELQAALKTAGSKPAQELAVLRAFLAASPAPSQPRIKKSGARTTLNLAHSLGHARATAANKQVQIKLDRDFSAIPRAELERALRAFLDVIEQSD
ncbi:MAG: ParB N-terminal domain-containing protein [Pseudomonadota bacterium]